MRGSIQPIRGAPLARTVKDYIDGLNNQHFSCEDGWCMVKTKGDQQNHSEHWLLYTDEMKLTAERYAKGKDTKRCKCMTLRWLLPMIFAMTGMELMCGGLHFATYRYVQKYAPDEFTANHTDSVLDDPVESAIPRLKLNLKFLDSVSGAFPLAFGLYCFYVFLSTDSQKPDATTVLIVWTKVCVSAALLFSLKGMLAAVTIVPDSSGWATCRDERLGPEGLAYMRQKHGFWELFTLDFWWVPKHKYMLRFCSDMMYSGHTFTVTLFGLGIYELIRIKSVHRRTGAGWKMALLTIVALGTLVEQAFEIYAVESTRFHYTMDVLMALVVTFLVYTNGPIAICAKQWAHKGFQFSDPCRLNKQHTRTEEDSKKQPSSEHAPLEWHTFVSRGDILIPVCCVPFCGYAGREHIYSDENLKDILTLYAENNFYRYQDEDEALKAPGDLYRKVLAYLKTQMCIDDGVSLQDFKTSCGCAPSSA